MSPPLTSVCSAQLSPSDSDLGLKVPGTCGDGNRRPEKGWERILATCVTEGKQRPGKVYAIPDPSVSAVGMGTK